MARPATVSDEKVFEILDALDQNGERITVNRIRQEVGGGNHSRYKKLIEQWKMANALIGVDDVGIDEKRRIALVDEVSRTIELSLFLRARFMSREFREKLTQDMAEQISSNLIRRGMINIEALGDAPPDPMQYFMFETSAAADEGLSELPRPEGRGFLLR